MRAMLASMALLVLAGCQVTPTPAVPLNSVKFAEEPVIIQRGNLYYLRYRISLADDAFKVRAFLETKADESAAYYFFGGYVSWPEYGNAFERPLAFDGYQDFASRGQVFWLDPDGAKHPIPLRQEP